MPADEQLGMARKFEFARGLFAQYRMAPQIQSLFPTERARPQQVIALHGSFAQVVRQGGEFERGQINSVQPHSRSDLFDHSRNRDRMWLAVTLDAVNLDGDLEQTVAEGSLRLAEGQYRLLCLHL